MYLIVHVVLWQSKCQPLRGGGARATKINDFWFDCTATGSSVSPFEANDGALIRGKYGEAADLGS